jgi:serine O-acetyltransferase
MTTLGAIPQMDLAATPFDWDIDSVVKDLSRIRNESLQQRNRIDRPSVLPSRSALGQLIDRLITALFPNRLSARQLTPENVDYFVGQNLDLSCRELVDQVCIELEFTNPTPANRKEIIYEAIGCVRSFASRLPNVRELLDTDILAAYESDPAAKSIDEVLVCYPGIFAMLHHRLAHELYLLGLNWIARIISELAHSKTGIEIHPGAQIGGAFFIDHGTGIVIGETSTIGYGVRIHHGVTLGAKTTPHRTKLTHDLALHSVRRHPLLEDHVIVYAGATLLGPITVGHGAVIGANVSVTADVAPGMRVTQAQSVLESFSEGAGI